MATERPPTIDPVAAAHWEQVAPPQSPWLHEEVGRRMEDRLQWIHLRPAVWADWDHGLPDTIPVPPSCVISTSTGRSQAYWLVE